jgi:undecaprenyl-diphosphatase
LASILIYFFRDWVQIVVQGFGMRGGYEDQSKSNRAMLWLLVVGSIPVGVFGLLFNKQAETTWRTPWVMGAMLIAVGGVLWLADRAGQKARELGSLHWADAVAVGMAQALAIVPGCSRSGITISAGLFRNMSREAAARFGFLLSAPAIAGAAAKTLWDMHKHNELHGLATEPFIVGVVVSAVTGCIVIAWFLHYLRHGSLRLFVYYRVIFGIIVLALAFIRRPA